MYLMSLLTILCLTFIEGSKILVCVPTPNFSHQVTFYPLIKGLLKKGHEVVFITTDPMYPKGKAPENLTEIDTHEISYRGWNENFLNTPATTGNKEDLVPQLEIVVPIVTKSFELQMLTPEVQKLIKEKESTYFDLLIIETIPVPALSLSHVFKAPVIMMSSLGPLIHNYHQIGAPTYPKLIYPKFWHQKLSNLTMGDKIRVLWDTYSIDWLYDRERAAANEMVKRLFGPDTPTLQELGNKVDMLFLNIYPIWEMNQPVPPSVVFIGGIHQKPQNALPKELKTYLDSSKRGVIYFSFGTNVKPSLLPPTKVQMFIDAFSAMPYDVLVKWDSEELAGTASNTKVVRWLPQSDLLRHPNVKAFITQGGLQSFDEALTGGVPLVGIPMFADQWYNVERYAALKIGVSLLIEELTVDYLVNAVSTVAGDPSYRRNMEELRDKLRDQPESALDRAVWWAEYVIRHKGASHLRSPIANMSWAEYLDVELMSFLALAVIFILSLFMTALYMIVTFVISNLPEPVKLKDA